jgi:hypothetical protein
MAMKAVKALQAVLDAVVAVPSLFRQSDTGLAQLWKLRHQWLPTRVARERLTEALNLPIHRCQTSETSESHYLVRIVEIAPVASGIEAVQSGILESKPT